MRALSTAVISASLLSGLLVTRPAPAHDRGTPSESQGHASFLESARGQLYLRAGLGGGYTWSRLDVPAGELSLQGWGPSAFIAPGIGLSKRLVLLLDLRGQMLPSGKLELAGTELAPRASAWQFESSLGVVAITGRGWFVEPTLGFAYSSLKIDSAPEYEKRRAGFCAGLALGWDGQVEGQMAAGAALRLGYVHTPEKSNVTEDYLGLTLEVALAKY